ncbi:YkgJ family cysteine cluster protein [Geoalkalibacter sp.]|uniref:YkgJ family cysteine cluster protein n=1 Tax=Geoalkalibacter sp. TaxID=3041440 RepID=UPI00272E7601|nr:YkgJ family cysteine cluster protein [Geoalkalibacter sp.]
MQDDWRQIKEQVRRDQEAFDRHSARLLEALTRRGVAVYCRRGCRKCCTLTVNATFVEALGIAQCLTPEQGAAVATHASRLSEIASAAKDFKEYLRTCRTHLGFCPLLDADGACGIYPVRPFACRALLSTRDSDWCAVDFSCLHPAEKQAFMSGLDPSVVAFPTHYVAAAQDLGREFEERTAAAMIKRFGFSLRGNLSFLISLEQQLGVSELVPQGLEVTRRALIRAGFDLPFVVHMESLGA